MHVVYYISSSGTYFSLQILVVVIENVIEGYKMLKAKISLSFKDMGPSKVDSKTSVQFCMLTNCYSQFGILFSYFSYKYIMTKYSY